MRIGLNALLLWLLTFPLLAQAEERIVPWSSWFVGAGGSLNTINFNQDMFASGVGNVYKGGTLVAAGQAGGPANPRQNTELTLAPTAQLGYFAHFAANDWLWGAKILYKYPAATATTPDIDPQAGTLTTIFGPDSFTGHVVIGSYRTRLDHEIAFMPFIGHSFARSYVYLGAGPALFGTQTKIDNATGLADFNGTRMSPARRTISRVHSGYGEAPPRSALPITWITAGSWISTIPMLARKNSRATFRLPSRTRLLAIRSSAPCSYRHRSA